MGAGETAAAPSSINAAEVAQQARQKHNSESGSEGAASGVPEGEPGCCDKPCDGGVITVTLPKDLLVAQQAVGDDDE